VRFNGIYGDVFKLPEPFVPKAGARIMNLQNPVSKMSKSEILDGGCVLLLDKPEDVLRAFKRAVTDSETSVRYDPENKPGVSNLMQIYSVCTGKNLEDIEGELAGQGYGALKQRVGEAVVETLRPIRDEALRLIADKAYLESVYTQGAEKASRAAGKTLKKVYKKIGFIPLDN
jgi:tryptophanyl-tRNA synthetase